MAGRRHRIDSTERLLNDVQQPAMRQGPRWIVEPPFSTGERMSVNDPLQPVDVLKSGHSKLPFSRGHAEVREQPGTLNY
jgi:hypothetical protein